MSERWTEIKRGSEGVSITLYEAKKGIPEVVDEVWWTWAEFLQMDVGPDIEIDERTILEDPDDE